MSTYWDGEASTSVNSINGTSIGLTRELEVSTNEAEVRVCLDLQKNSF
ncbi:hypothetical protein [Spirobacillus cienkowskii]